MANKYLDLVGLPTENKYTIELPKLIDNRKTTEVGDDLSFNGGQKIIPISRSTTEQQLNALKSQDTQRNIVTSGNNLVEQNIGDTVSGEQAQDFKDRATEVQDNYNYYKNVVAAGDKQGNLSIKQRDDTAANLYMRNEIASIMDGIGIAEQAGNIASLLLIPKESIDLGRVFGLDAGIKSTKFVRQFSKSFTRLPPEQKVVVFDELIGKVQGVTDNEVRQLLLLLDLTGETSDFEADWNFKLDKLDAALMLASGLNVAGHIITSRRALNAINTTRKLDTTKTAELVDAGIKNNDVAKALGLNNIDSANVVDLNKVDILEGADTQTATQVRKIWERQDGINTRMTTLLDEGLGLDEAQKLAVVDNEVIRVTKDLTNESKIISNVQGRVEGNNIVIGFDETVEVPVLYKSGAKKGLPRPNPEQVTTRQSMSRTFNTDDVTGALIDNELSTLKRYTTSPMVAMGKDRGLLVQGYERLGNASAAIKATLFQNLNMITKGLNSKSLGTLNSVLHKGNREGEVYTVHQLMNQGVDGVRLSRKEAVAYAGTRKLVDDMWSLEDLAITRTMNAQGLKRVLSPPSQKGDDIAHVYAKPYNEVQAAWNAYERDTHKLIKLPTAIGDPKALQLDLSDLRKFYDEGYVLTRAIKDENNLFQVQGTRTVWALSKASDMGNITGGVLGYNKGYVPQIGINDNYFVKTDAIVNIDGRQDVLRNAKTLATFGNKIDADDWMVNMAAQRATNGEPPLRMSRLSDREIDDVILQSDSIQRWGGLFNGKRSSSSIPHIQDGETSERTFVNVYEALQRNVNHIGNKLPASEYRIGVEKVWMNTAANHAPDIFKENITFDKAVSLIRDSSGLSAHVKTKLMASADQIQYMNKIPTSGEENFLGTITGIANSIEGIPGGKAVARFIYRNNSFDPINSMKSGTFHAMLGMFTPVQYFIQGSGATVALATHPIAAGRALPKMPVFTALDNITDYDTRLKAAQVADKWMKRVGLISKETDLHSEYMLWHKSGMREGIIHANADAALVYSGNNVSEAGWRAFLTGASNKASKTLKAGTTPYSMGELVNSRMSFFTALEQAKETKKVTKMSDADLKGIMNNAERYRLNMNKANKAAYQKRGLGLTTQFMSVNARFAEAMTAGHWTGKEKFALLAGQATMFGAIGVPLLDWSIKQILHNSGAAPEDFSAQAYSEMREGLLGFMLGDADIEATGRVALGQGFADQMIDLATKEGSWSALLMGPSYTVADKSVKAAELIINSTRMVFSADELTVAHAGLLGELYAGALAQIPSSSRKAWAAWHVNNDGFYRDSNGRPVMFSQASKWELLAQGMGFTSKEYIDYMDATIADMDRSERKKEDTKLIINMWNRTFTALDNNNMPEAEAVTMFIGGILSGYSLNDRTDIMNAITTRTSLANDAPTKLLIKNLKEMGSSWSNAANNLSNFMLNELPIEGED